MRRCVGFVVLACIAVLALPEQAFAWGPGVHMVISNWVLQNLNTLPLPVATAIMNYPGRFLHGCLSADIFIGKGSVAKEGHSHNWSSGFALLNNAVRLRDQAYAYGYLSHLAADTVAHNVYVPGSFHLAPGTSKMAHVYLEIQADRLLSWDSADALRVFHEAGSRRDTAILRNSMAQKAFKFWLKRHLFEGSIAIGGGTLWRTSMQLLDKFFPEKQREQVLAGMLTVSTRAVISLLRDTATSPVLTLDPIGADALALAAEQRAGKSVLLQNLKTSLALPFTAPAPELGEAECSPLNVALPEALASCPAVCVQESTLRP